VSSGPAAVLVAITLAVLACGAPADARPREAVFTSRRAAEVLARLTVRCDGCAWETSGREAVTLSITLDDRAVQHLPIVRRGRADYVVFLGPVRPGTHTVRVDEDPDGTARELRGRNASTIEDLRIEHIDDDQPEYTALSLAPIIHARPNADGRFTDVPVFM
jgi:hypothetical protein